MKFLIALFFRLPLLFETAPVLERYHMQINLCKTNYFVIWRIWPRFPSINLTLSFLNFGYPLVSAILVYKYNLYKCLLKSKGMQILNIFVPRQICVTRKPKFPLLLLSNFKLSSHCVNSFTQVMATNEILVYTRFLNRLLNNYLPGCFL